MMQLPQVIDGLSNFHFSSTNALSPQFVVLGAMEWLQVAMVILVVATLVMVAYYRYLWKCAKADSDHWLEISEKLASHQHPRAMEGLHEFRAFSRRRRRRLAAGRRVDMDTPAGQPEGEADYAGEQAREAGVQAEQDGGDDDGTSDSSTRRDAERRERYRHCGLEEASDPGTWMEVRHHSHPDEDDHVSDDLGLIKDACRGYEMDEEQFIELLEAYGGDHLKTQILTALGTVVYYLDQARVEGSGRLMADVQYKIGGSTFVHPGLRQYLPAAEQEDLRLYYEESNESMVVRLADRPSELLNMPNNLKEPFITRMMELSNVRRLSSWQG